MFGGRRAPAVELRLARLELGEAAAVAGPSLTKLSTPVRKLHGARLELDAPGVDGGLRLGDGSRECVAGGVDLRSGEGKLAGAFRELAGGVRKRRELPPLAGEYLAHGRKLVASLGELGRVRHGVVELLPGVAHLGELALGKQAALLQVRHELVGSRGDVLAQLLFSGDEAVEQGERLVGDREARVEEGEGGVRIILDAGDERLLRGRGTLLVRGVEHGLPLGLGPARPQGRAQLAGPTRDLVHAGVVIGDAPLRRLALGIEGGLCGVELRAAVHKLGFSVCHLRLVGLEL